MWVVDPLEVLAKLRDKWILKEDNVPNWCKNKVTLAVAADKRDILDSAMEQLRGNIPHFPYFDQPTTSFSLEKIDPTPQELLKSLADMGVAAANNKQNVMKARYGAPDWPSWRHMHWGTRWDVSAEEPVITEDFNNEIVVATYEFESPWNPPLKALRTLSENFPGLICHISYDETGDDFSGVSAYINGFDVYGFTSTSLNNLKNSHTFEHYWNMVHTWDEDEDPDGPAEDKEVAEENPSIITNITNITKMMKFYEEKNYIKDIEF